MRPGTRIWRTEIIQSESLETSWKKGPYKKVMEQEKECPDVSY